MTSHPLEDMLNAKSDDILTAIIHGFRAIIDVKGKLAELFLFKIISELEKEGIIDHSEWIDEDSNTDFVVVFKGKTFKIECKNIRSKELYKSPRAYKVEVQKTRNSKDGSNTRSYKITEFDILAACLFNHTNKWEYSFICTSNLSRKKDNDELLSTYHRVPIETEAPWKNTLLETLEEAASIK